MDGTTGKVLEVLRAFPRDEPTKKRYVTEMIAWSAKAGDYPNGDPELHHVAGTLFAEGTCPGCQVACHRRANDPFPCLQKAIFTTPKGILHSEPRIPLNNLLRLNMTGTCKMIPTPPPSMPPEPSFPIS